MSRDSLLIDLALDAVLFFVALAGIALGVMLAAGCAPSPPKPTPPVPAGIPICDPAPELDPDRICRGLFTASGAPCVSCGGAAGCYDKTTGVYCVLGPCLSDGECASEHADVFGKARR